MPKRSFITPLSAVCAVSIVLGLAGPAAAADKLSLSGADPSVRPQDDFFSAVNGAWLRRTEIPADKLSYGAFEAVEEKATNDVRTLLATAAVDRPGRDAETRLIGNFYASILDVTDIKRHGLESLAPLLADIHNINGPHGVARVMGELQRVGVDVPLGAGVSADAKSPDINAVYWDQGGLGLPDRDYYLKKDKAGKKVLVDYQRYLATLDRLAGVSAPQADREAAAAVHLEVALAKIQWDRVQMRDPLKTYTVAPRDRWTADYGSFPWQRFASAVQQPLRAKTIVREPSYLKAFSQLSANTSASTWQAYFQLRLLDTLAGKLAPEFRKARFRFKLQELRGVKQQAPTWRTAVYATDDALGEAIGSRYVKEHFPPSAKARVKSMVHNILAIYAERLGDRSWMAPATRQAAVTKLSQLTVKIAYPDKWRGFKGLTVYRNDAVGNLLNVARYEYDRDMAEAGGKVDRSRWDMTPQTVNAYYNPTGNEIVFPAAILQPPFFDPQRDEAYNYGGIGSVIGHEISHGFDDEGRRYDGHGALKEWWTPADGAAFTQRADKLASQYSSYEPLPGKHVNGKLTLGENIADLGGVEVALLAYRRAEHGATPQKIDGLSADQRFFVGYGLSRRSKLRPQFLDELLVSDPHSPDEYRTNGVLTNVDAFYDAFDLKAGDKLYKQPQDRIHIW